MSYVQPGYPPIGPSSPVYMDHHASTPCCTGAIRDMVRALETLPGNPSSSHASGRAARDAIELARLQIADLLLAGEDPLPGYVRERNLQRESDVADAARGVVFTSGASESNALALRGMLDAWRRDVVRKYGSLDKLPQPHILVAPVEHSSIVAPLRRWYRDQGINLEMLPVNAAGAVDPEELRRRIKPGETLMVSVQGANNEIGTVQPLEEIARICAENKVTLHADLAQSAGRIPVPRGVDLATVSAHKLYGPKGIGCLWIAPHLREWIEPQIVGAQEQGLRGGTLNTPSIVGFGSAAQHTTNTWLRPPPGTMPEGERLRRLRDWIWQYVRGSLGDDRVRLNGPALDDPRARLPHNLNFALVGVCPKAFHQMIEDDVVCSQASACKAVGGDRSHVLDAIGAEDVGATVRLGLGSCNGPEDAQRAAESIVKLAKKLHGTYPPPTWPGAATTETATMTA